MARHHSHSHTEEPKAGVVNSLEIQQATKATHILNQQKALSDQLVKVLEVRVGTVRTN